MIPEKPGHEPEAAALNERLGAAAPEVLGTLSALGRRMYFPDGTIRQAEEARKLGARIDAAGGLAHPFASVRHRRELHRWNLGAAPRLAGAALVPAAAPGGAAVGRGVYGHLRSKVPPPDKMAPPLCI